MTRASGRAGPSATNATTRPPGESSLVLAARCADPLLSLSDIGRRLRGARYELARLGAVLRAEPLPEPAEPIQPVRHDLEFECVVFRHGDRTVIDNALLSVPEGRRIAIVGPWGAGKSTLLHLLARFYDVDVGAVRVGGVDVRGVDTEVLMAQIAVVECRRGRREAVGR